MSISGNAIAKLLILLTAGAICGLLAKLASLPLPFMLGGLCGSLMVTAFANRRAIAMPFPRVLRMFFVGLIGAMIGGTFSPAIVAAVPGMIVTLIAVAIYVCCAQSAG